ncbi:TetR family transcriptional regulator [Actinoplanes sp. NPDC049265]|uniref:TetR/AcrR family transcriptional regulator n=1 Tax=Actinoplanes sp. NPDC049265 TaxID=3363902 RepID=UPI00370FCEB3
MRDGFQRARRPEQVAERRASILAVARDLLTQRRLTEISLRELSLEVGLSKSNVLRYFDSREAIFLELLKAEWTAWLDALDDSPPAPAGGPWGPSLAVADILARTLAERPLLCELFSSLAAVLEHNISLEYAREFKMWSREHQLRLHRWLTDRLPGLADESAFTFAVATVIISGAVWPYKRRSETLVEAARQLGEPAEDSFEADLRTGLRAHLIGTVILTDSAGNDDNGC